MAMYFNPGCALSIHRPRGRGAAQMPCHDVVVSCVSCIKAMDIGGRAPRHLVDLLFGDATAIGTLGYPNPAPTAGRIY